MREEELLYSAPVEEEQPALDELEIEKTARRYQTGDGVEKDLDEALRWYRKSKSSLARYASALIWQEKGHTKRQSRNC